MSDKPTEEPEVLGAEEEKLLEEESPMRALLKRSLAEESFTSAPPPDEKELLASVQKKIRKRSRGKFYADGWSTSQSRLNYVLVAAMMLVTIVAVYLALGPTGFTR